MEVYVLGNDLEIIDMIDSYESIIWTVQYFSQNDFQLIVPATPYYIKLLQKDRLLCQYECISDHRFLWWFHYVFVLCRRHVFTDAE